MYGGASHEQLVLGIKLVGAGNVAWCSIQGHEETRTHINGVHVLADATRVEVGWLTASIHLLWVCSILGVEVLDLTIREDSVELTIALEGGVTELCEESEALLLASQLQQIWPLAHDSSATSGHLEHALFFRVPRDHVELLSLHTKYGWTKYSYLGSLIRNTRRKAAIYDTSLESSVNMMKWL
jgi:hypothetical protein